MTQPKKRILFHELNFPTDVYGFTSAVKKELLALTGKIGTDSEKIKILQATIAVIMPYLKQQLEDNKAAIVKAQLEANPVSEDIQ